MYLIVFFKVHLWLGSFSFFHLSIGFLYCNKLHLFVFFPFFFSNCSSSFYWFVRILYTFKILTHCIPQYLYGVPSCTLHIVATGQVLVDWKSEWYNISYGNSKLHEVKFVFFSLVVCCGTFSTDLKEIFS